MTKQDEIELKEILSRYATINGFLSCLDTIKTYAKNVPLIFGSGINVIFNETYNSIFELRRTDDNHFKLIFTYENEEYVIVDKNSCLGNASVKNGKLICNTEVMVISIAIDMFKRLDEENRKERNRTEFLDMTKPLFKDYKHLVKFDTDLTDGEIQKAIKIFKVIKDLK